MFDDDSTYEYTHDKHYSEYSYRVVAMARDRTKENACVAFRHKHAPSASPPHEIAGQNERGGQASDRCGTRADKVRRSKACNTAQLALTCIRGASVNVRLQPKAVWCSSGE